MVVLIHEGLIDMSKQAPPGFVAHAFGELKLFTQQVPEVSVDDQLVLNENQPRKRSHWESPALRNQIEQAHGLFTPPLVQPLDELTPDGRPKYEVIDGHRRVTALRHLLRILELRHESGSLNDEEYNEERARYSHITIECTHRRLSQDELVKAWILIHRERKEWSLSEKEATAHTLIHLVGTRDAARFLGMTIPAVEKLGDIYEYAEKIRVPDEAQKETGKDPRITWAREIRNLREDIRNDEEVVESLIVRINAGDLKNSKDIRALRDLWPTYREQILDVRKDLVRDIATPNGFADPVRATRSRSAAPEDLGRTLAQMEAQIKDIKLEQLQGVRTAKDKVAAARKSIEAMRVRLQELEDLIS